MSHVSSFTSFDMGTGQSGISGKELIRQFDIGGDTPVAGLGGLVGVRPQSLDGKRRGGQSILLLNEGWI